MVIETILLSLQWYKYTHFLGLLVHLEFTVDCILGILSARQSPELELIKLNTSSLNNR